MPRAATTDPSGLMEMCGRFSLSASGSDLIQQFNLAGLPAWRPRYNIAPMQEVLIVLKMSDAPKRQAHLLRWGLISMWAKGPAVGSRMTNDPRKQWLQPNPVFPQT